MIFSDTVIVLICIEKCYFFSMLDDKEGREGTFNRVSVLSYPFFFIWFSFVMTKAMPYRDIYFKQCYDCQNKGTFH